MKFISLLMALLISFQLTCYPTAADAAVSFSNGAVSGQASVNKVGNLLIADGLAVMSATTMTISSPNQSPSLQGNLFKVEQVGGKVNGQVFFKSGPGLSTLDEKNCDEYVRTIDGRKVAGPISDVSSDAVTCGGRSIPMSQVEEISSGRVFKFSSATGENPKMSFNSTCQKPTASKEVREKKPVSKLTKVMVVGVLLAGVACAIAIPVAIACSSGGGGNRNRYYGTVPVAPVGGNSGFQNNSSFSSCGP